MLYCAPERKKHTAEMRAAAERLSQYRTPIAYADQSPVRKVISVRPGSSMLPCDGGRTLDTPGGCTGDLEARAGTIGDNSGNGRTPRAGASLSPPEATPRSPARSLRGTAMIGQTSLAAAEPDVAEFAFVAPAALRK
jgi:hypothetical protein